MRPTITTNTVRNVGADLKVVAEDPTQRVQALMDQARALAREACLGFAQELSEAAQHASMIGNGGDAFPVGVREVARRLEADLAAAHLNITAILGRG